MRCGTMPFYVTIEENNEQKTHRVSARSNIDARKIVRKACGEAVRIIRVEK